MDWSHYFSPLPLVERLRTLLFIKDLVSNELESLGMLCSARISRPDREVLLLKKRLVAKVKPVVRVRVLVQGRTVWDLLLRIVGLVSPTEVVNQKGKVPVI